VTTILYDSHSVAVVAPVRPDRGFHTSMKPYSAIAMHDGSPTAPLLCNPDIMLLAIFYLHHPVVEPQRDSMSIQVCPFRHTLAPRHRSPVPPSKSHPLALLSEETDESTHRPGPTSPEAGIMYPECPSVRLDFTLSQTLILSRKRTLREKGRMPRCRAAAMGFSRNDCTSSLIAMPVINKRQMILGTAFSRSLLVLVGLLVRLSAALHAEAFNVDSSVGKSETSVCWCQPE
jgi:hypothetical protein